VSGAATPPPDGEALLAAHYLPVMRLCLSRLRDPADAEDAAQETFRRAVQNAAALRDDALPWLLTVARNVCTDELRRRQRMAGMVLPDDAAPDAGPTPEGVVVGRLSAVELLGRLTPGERRAVAARLGSLGETPATSTTRVLLARARDKVRRYLEDTQSAFGTATVSATEALHQLRARFAGRTLIGSGRAAMLIPAALIIGVVGGPASAPGTLVPAPPFSPAPSAVMPGPGDALQAHVGATPARAGSVLVNAGRALADAAPVTQNQIQLPPPPGNWFYSLPNGDYRQVDTTDVEPSPFYAQDHTVLMIGPGHDCKAPDCSQIYRSADGGATWTAVSSLAILGSQLVLPASAYPEGRYYVVGVSGVEATRDNGGTFTAVVPGVDGYATVPPPSSGLDMVYSNENALWGIRHDGTPTVLSAFQDGQQAGGAPAVVVSPTGYTVLQPVMPVTSYAPSMERCTPACGAPAPLPTMGPPQLVPSPDIAADHTMFGFEPGLDLAVSHDDGATFTVVPGASVFDLAVAEGPYGLRLVAAVGTSGSLAYSDDDGRTWQAAALPTTQLTGAHSITRLRAGRLIASMARTGTSGWYDFVCSADGATWSLCAPDNG